MEKDVRITMEVETQRGDVQKRMDAYTRRMLTEVIDQLIDIRKGMGLTQQEVADASDMKAPNVTRLETKTVFPSLKVLSRYADALGYELKLTLEPRKEKE